MHGTQTDAGLLGQLTLTDVRMLVDQVHHFKVGIGVLGLAFGIHLFKFPTLPPCRVTLQHEILFYCVYCSTLNIYTVN